jgi:cell division septal protein FtsQ
MLDKSTLKRKKKTKKGKALLFYFFMIALLSALAYGYKALNSHLQENLSKFELTDIQISGNYILTDKEILRFLGLKTGEKLLEISAVDVVEKLKKSTYVRAVNAVYSLPSTMRINIQERDPVAFIYGRGLNMIDKENYILPVPDKNIRWNLPVITGITENLGLQGTETVSKKARQGVAIARYVTIIDMPLREMVSEISFANKNYIEVGLSGSDAVIRISQGNYQEQLFIAARYLRDYLDFNHLDKLEYVDVRFADQIIIKEHDV